MNKILLLGVLSDGPCQLFSIYTLAFLTWLTRY